jgi:hypothetical protein
MFAVDPSTCHMAAQSDRKTIKILQELCTTCATPRVQGLVTDLDAVYVAV